MWVHGHLTEECYNKDRKTITEIIQLKMLEWKKILIAWKYRKNISKPLIGKQGSWTKGKK